MRRTGAVHTFYYYSHILIIGSKVYYKGDGTTGNVHGKRSFPFGYFSIKPREAIIMLSSFAEEL